MFKFGGTIILGVWEWAIIGVTTVVLAHIIEKRLRQKKLEA